MYRPLVLEFFLHFLLEEHVSRVNMLGKQGKKYILEKKAEKNCVGGKYYQNERKVTKSHNMIYRYTKYIDRTN